MEVFIAFKCFTYSFLHLARTKGLSFGKGLSRIHGEKRKMFIFIKFEMKN